jgi:hypothetical protein
LVLGTVPIRNGPVIQFIGSVASRRKAACRRSPRRIARLRAERPRILDSWLARHGQNFTRELRPIMDMR